MSYTRAFYKISKGAGKPNEADLKNFLKVVQIVQNPIKIAKFEIFPKIGFEGSKIELLYV
jgi:hypothetical protein